VKGVTPLGGLGAEPPAAGGQQGVGAELPTLQQFSCFFKK